MAAATESEKAAAVVSVCHAADAAIWRLAAPRILRHIASRRYQLIVPAREVELFRSLTPPDYEVVSEDGILEGLTLDSVRQRMPEAMRSRAGWYFQQLLKLAALLRIRCRGNEMLVIWDADTIPLRPLQFSDAEGRLLYFTSDDDHPIYFEVIRRLLGLEKIVPFSFIAQCFPVRAAWLRGFVDFVERRHGCTWPEAILRTADFNDVSGFSEYETLGTYLSHRHAYAMASYTVPWLRYGYQLYDPDDPASLPEEGDGYYYASFERWDPHRPKRP